VISHLPDPEFKSSNDEVRNARHTYVTPSEEKQTWSVQQMLVDPEGHNDWAAKFAVDLAHSLEIK
jgi:hypothetical protein